MLVVDKPTKDHSALQQITVERPVANSLAETVPVPTIKSKQPVIDQLRNFFDNDKVSRFEIIASMDDKNDQLSIALNLLTAVTMLAMPRPRFDDNLKISLADKTAVETAFKQCQNALQTFTQRLHSYNAQSFQKLGSKNDQLLDCLAGLLIGYLSKGPKPVE